MGQTNDSWNQRSIYDVETSIPSPSKEIQNNVTGKEDQGNCLLYYEIVHVMDFIECADTV
jgi:hypothetical protein